MIDPEYGLSDINYNELIDRMREEMGSIPPDHQVGMAIRGAFAAIDELIVLAASPDTRSLVCDEKIALGQILTRCQMLCSFAMATKPGPILVRERA